MSQDENTTLCKGGKPPRWGYHTMEIIGCQYDEYLEPLSDLGRDGAERPWREKKMQNEMLALAYDVVDPHKAARLRHCCSYVAFKMFPDGTKRLDSISSCRVRLCPVCAWRRSLKTYANVRKICTYLQASEQQRFVLLTLTVKNCKPEQLDTTLNGLFASLNRFALLKPFKNAFTGWYRSLEITHNLENNTFHPHFHIICSCNKSYFTSRNYLSHAKILQMWKESARLDYDPQVDIRRVKVYQDQNGVDVVDLAGACAEIAKYSVKDSDYIIPDDWDLTIDTVDLLDKVLYKRRLVGYGGLFRFAHKKLNLDDEDTGDLTNIEDLDIHPDDTDYTLVIYTWYSGYRQYFAHKRSGE